MGCVSDMMYPRDENMLFSLVDVVRTQIMVMMLVTQILVELMVIVACYFNSLFICDG